MIIYNAVRMICSGSICSLISMSSSASSEDSVVAQNWILLRLTITSFWLIEATLPTKLFTVVLLVLSLIHRALISNITSRPSVSARRWLLFSVIIAQIGEFNPSISTSTQTSAPFCLRQNR